MLIELVDITSSNLGSSNIPRVDSGVDGAADYDSGTIYAEGDKVIYPPATGTDLYESLENSNQGNQPDTSPTKWLHLGKVNRWRMFDSYIGGSQSEATDEIEVVIAQSSITHVALFGLDATSVVISHLDADDAVLYSTEYDLFENVLLPTDYYDFFFGPAPKAATQLIKPLRYSTVEGEKVKIEIRKTGTVKCGKLAVGYGYTLGTVQKGVEPRLLDYSKYQTDTFGRTTLAQGAAAKLLQVSFLARAGSESHVWSQIEKVRGKLSVFDFNSQHTDHEILALIGYYRDMYEIMEDKNKTYLTLEAVGIT